MDGQYSSKVKGSNTVLVDIPVIGSGVDIVEVSTGGNTYRYGTPINLKEGKAPSVSNILFFNGIMRQRFGYATNSKDITGSAAVLYLGKFGGKMLAAYSASAAAGNLAYYDSGWNTLCALNYTYASAPFLPYGASLFSKFYFTDGEGYVKAYDGTSAVNVSGSGAPKYAKHVAGFSNRLWLANVKTDSDEVKKTMVMWSEYIAPTTFDSGSSSYDLLLESPTEGVSGLRKFSNYLVVFQPHRSTLVNKIDYPHYFSFNTVNTKVGAISPTSIHEIEGGLVFLGPDNVYWSNFGSPTFESVGDPIKHHLTKYTDMRTGEPSGSETAYLGQRAVAFNDMANKLYYLFTYPLSGTYMKYCYLWNYKENTWSIHEYPAVTDVHTGFTTVCHDDTLFDYSTPGFYAGSLNGKVYLSSETGTTDAGTVISAQCTSKIFVGSGDGFCLEGLHLHGTGKVKLTIYYRNTEYDTSPHDTETFTSITLPAYQPTRATGRCVQFKFENVTAGDSFVLSKMMLRIIPRGERWSE